LSKKDLPIEKPVQNWTKFPNIILDNIEKFTSAEFKILGLMVRKNIGYDKPNKRFSISYISSKTGLSDPTVIKAINGLLSKKSIKIIGSGQRSVRLFDINWIDPQTTTTKETLPVKKFNRSKNFSGTTKETLPEPVKKLYPLQENKSIRKQTTTTQPPQSLLNIFPKTLKLTPRKKLELELLIDEHGIDYVKANALYAINNFRTNFWAYFKKSCENDYATENETFENPNDKPPEHLKDGTVVIFSGKEYTVEAGGFLYTDYGCYAPGQVAAAVASGLMDIK